jgi:hypothetical protein
MSSTISQTVRQYLATKAALDSAALALADLELQLKDELAAIGGESIEVDGSVVKLFHGSRRIFDAQSLRKLVTPHIFRKVTESKVVASKFDAAIITELISEEVASKVVSTTDYTYLRVK